MTKKKRKQQIQERPFPRLWLAGLAGAGLAVSLYLSYVHYFAVAPFCPTGAGCQVVQSSPYALLAGVPVALLGVGGYGAILTLSLVRHARRFYLPLFSVAWAGLAFSAYLTYLEAAVIKAFCLYCLASLGLISAISGLLWHYRWRADPSALPRLGSYSLLLGALVIAIAVIMPRPAPAAEPAPTAAPALDYPAALAQHLTATGAVEYGAYWCPHCAEQKELFGAGFKYIKYVECDPRGANAQPSLCRQKGIRGYPTWEIGGKMYEGALSLERLAQLSGFIWSGPGR